MFERVGTTLHEKKKALQDERYIEKHENTGRDARMKNCFSTERNCRDGHFVDKAC